MGMSLPKGVCPECLEKDCQRHAKPSKYRSRKTTATIEGRPVKFDSRREKKRFAILHLFQTHGLISLLSRQPRFRLVVNGALVCTYVADFQYYDRASGRMIVEDAKGVRTRAYRIKAKLFAALTGFTITEV